MASKSCPTDCKKIVSIWCVYCTDPIAFGLEISASLEAFLYLWYWISDVGVDGQYYSIATVVVVVKVVVVVTILSMCKF